MKAMRNTNGPSRAFRQVAAYFGVLVIGLGLQRGSIRADEASCQNYQDSDGKSVTLHPRSFVDRLICPKAGCSPPLDSAPVLNDLMNAPENVLGPPTYLRRAGRGKGRGIYSLGCRGSGVWEFTDNLIFDVPGPDILVFEVGRAKEPTQVEVSEDNVTWIDVGPTDGSRSSVDISSSSRVRPGQKFRFIRLTDLGDTCDRRTPGADIDAIATYGYSWTHVFDEGARLYFATGSAELTEQGKAEIDRVMIGISERPNFRVEVVGHTDWVGGEDGNQKLSEDRAATLGSYLAERGYFPSDRVKLSGRGELLPIADNATPEGRAMNRRVELTFVSVGPCPQQPPDVP